MHPRQDAGPALAKKGGCRISPGRASGWGTAEDQESGLGGGGALRNLKLRLQTKYGFYSCCMFIGMISVKAAGIIAIHVLPANYPSAQPPLAVSLTLLFPIMAA